MRRAFERTMKWRSLVESNGDTLRGPGSILIGAGVYAGLPVISIQFGTFFADLPSGIALLLLLGILVIPVIVYIQLTGMNPASFFPLAVLGAVIAFFAILLLMPRDHAQEGGFIPFLLFGGTIPILVGAHYPIGLLTDF